MAGTSKKIDFRSLCYGVDKCMDAPEPGYLFPGKTIFYPMKRNRVDGSGRASDKEKNQKT